MRRNRPLKELVAAWLELTKDGPPAGGLDREEALRRAVELRRRFQEGQARLPDTLDEDSKDVLFALVSLLEDSPAETVEARQQEARAVFEFISARLWTPDEFGEKAELLSRCAELSGGPMAPETLQAGVPIGKGPSRSEEVLEHEVERVLQDSVPLLRLILRKRFELKGRQAAEFEEDLRHWLLRFCRRRDSDSRGRQYALFRACSELASGYRRTKRVSGEGSSPEEQHLGPDSRCRSVPVQRDRGRNPER